ncbi:MAG: PD-(D/E)XK nuclease family protein [Runella sp.]
MLQTFLEKAAQHIFEAHTNSQSLEHLCIVVPTRRAGYFFKRALAQCSDVPFLAPEVVAIDDFVSQRCDVEIADNVSLLFELYDIFKQTDPLITFDRYLQWATMLLRDFDQIDQYLIDAAYLFSYVSEAKALERWKIDWPNSHVSAASERIKGYFELFANLHKVYVAFKEDLQSRRRAYRGMAYRTLAERTDELLLSNEQFYYFVGFNALSKAEEKIIKTLLKAKRAEVLWDSDYFYLRDNPYIEGGKLLRQYKEAGWAGAWKWTDEYLRTTPKDINVYALPNASMQAKVAGALYKQWQDDEKGGSDKRPVAIVLADENMLLPVLNSLDESITELNVTMGLTLRNSLLFTLIDALFELQFTIAEFRSKEGREIKIPKFHHRTVHKVLNHPFIRRYEFLAMQGRDSSKSTVLQTALDQIKKNNWVYLDAKQLLEWGGEDPLFKVLFTRWTDDPRHVITVFYELIDLLREVYSDTQNAIETEYLYLFYTLLKQLETTLQAEHIVKLNLRTFRAFLYELIRQTRIPFSGEPVSSLQIIGMLETRALDFERMIILSMNEGVFPPSKRQNSLIPWDIAREVGLPVYSDNDAVVSYHFFRLLQRAREVHLLYVTDPNTYNGGEKSRFILQIEHELVPYSGENIKFREQVVHFEIPSEDSTEHYTPTAPDWSVPKNPEILAFLKQSLVEKGLYATHFSQYLRCSLQYYFSRVAKVSEDEEVEERMGAAEFGTWIHAILENIDVNFLMQGQAIEDQQVKQIMAEEFKKQFGGYEADSGINRLIYRVAEQTILEFINHQRQQNPPIQVLANEKTLSTTIEANLSNNEVLPLKVAGKIDRIELVGNILRVADYKTGKIDTLSNVSPDKIEPLLLQSPKDKDEKIRQLWIYQYLIYKKMMLENGLRLHDREFHLDQYEVVSGFYSLRNIDKGFIQNPLSMGDADSYVRQTEEYIKKFVVEHLLNSQQPFQKTTDTNVCKYCDFREICGR